MNTQFTYSFIAILISLSFWSGRSIDESVKEAPSAPSILRAVDTIMANMTLEERIGQLFVLKSWNKDASGYILDSGDSFDTLPTPNNVHGIPYWIGYDIRNNSNRIFPYELLGRMNDSLAINHVVQSYAKQLKLRNVNFILGPNADLLGYDSDIDYNSSYSDDPQIVSALNRQVQSAFKRNGIDCVIGSFPGLGSAQHTLEGVPPLLLSKSKKLKRNDWIPFKAHINSGLNHILLANVKVPAIDSGTNWLASNSPRMGNELKNTLGFQGLIWSDLTESYGTSVVDHFLAGNDIMIIDSMFTRSVNNILDATEKGLIIPEDIDNRCRRVLEAKLSMRMDGDSTRVVANDVVNEVRLVSESMVLLRNDSLIIPLNRLDQNSIGLVKIGAIVKDDFAWLLHRYAPGQTHQLSFENLENDYSDFAKSRESLTQLIIIAEPQEDLPRKRFGLSMHMQSVIERMASNQDVIFIWKGNPKALIHVSAIPQIKAILVSSTESGKADDIAIQAVFGGRALTGRLRRKVGGEFNKSFGLDTEKTRLAYGLPEEVGIKSEFLYPIDSIVKEAILQKATPGAQIWFAKDGVVVYHKAIGHHTYQNEDTVRVDDLYDIASITKIAGSVAALMKLTQDSLFNLDYNLCDYLDEWVDTTAYRNMGMREILAHQAGLPPFIPFYAKTLKKGVPRFDIYSLAQNEIYPFRVARELYISKEQPDKMFRQIINHPVKEKRYKYSDVGYYFMLRIIEKQSGMPMNQYLDKVYYRPLGMTTMTYRPLEKFDKSRITPTELDRYFRNQLVHGDVHDPGAAMLGGVAGHAGLFSNANDLGKLMQMYLNQGEYGGERFFDSTVIQDFVRCQFCENDNRRGAGFDKPVFEGAGPTCGCTTKEAFGHQGFTGTTTWADPDKKVVYVFLSNRVYPNAENRKLATMNVRTDIQQVFYDAIEKSRPNTDAVDL